MEASLSSTVLEVDALQRAELSGVESPDGWDSSGV